MEATYQLEMLLPAGNKRLTISALNLPTFFSAPHPDLDVAEGTVSRLLMVESKYAAEIMKSPLRAKSAVTKRPPVQRLLTRVAPPPFPLLQLVSVALALQAFEQPQSQRLWKSGSIVNY